MDDRRRSGRLIGVRHPCRPPPGSGARKRAASQGIGGVEAARDMLDVEAKLLYLVEPAGQKAVDVPLRA